MTTYARLHNDDFMALRSLARSRWEQGREIEWKINRRWQCTPYPSAALDAAERLIEMGLVERFVCCKNCGEVFQLTEAGQARASQINRLPIVKAPDAAPQLPSKENHMPSSTKSFFKEHHLWGLLLIGGALAVWIIAHRQESPPSFKTDPVSGHLALQASGCVITDAYGKSIKEDLLEQLQTRGKVMIPQGSLLNGDCFPAAKAAIAAELKQEGN